MSAPWRPSPVLDWDADASWPQRLAALPEELKAASRRLLAGVAAEIPGGLDWVAELARWRTLHRFQRELSALSRALDVPWRQLMLANLSYDLALSVFGCSTVALATREGPVVARNMDWWPEDLLARASVLERVCSRGRLVQARAGWVGAVGAVTGLSGRGFALILNAVSVPAQAGVRGSSKAGYPVLLFLRRVLDEARGFDDALRRIEKAHLASPALITLVGERNAERVVVERSPRQARRRVAEGDAPLIATNNYRALFDQGAHAGNELTESTCARYDILCERLADRGQEPPEDAELLYLLSDPAVRQTITAQHVIIAPRRRDMRLFTPAHLHEDPPP